MPCVHAGYQEIDLFSEIRGKPQPDFDSVFGSSGGPQGPTLSQENPKPPLGWEIFTPEAEGIHANMQQSQHAQGTTGFITDIESNLAQAPENLCKYKCGSVCLFVCLSACLPTC